MSETRPKVLLACDQRVRDDYLDPADITRLEQFADWQWFECEGGEYFEAGDDVEAAARLGGRLGDIDALVVCHGSPRVTGPMMDKATGMKFLGDMEGDRLAQRIDVEAAWERDIRTVDTNNGSSYPVAEWALALIIICMRNAGLHFRRLITGQPRPAMHEDPGYMDGELVGKRVGLIGCGHIGRRLITFLRPFNVDVWVHDPYLANEMADAVGFLKTSLDNVLSQCDAVVCLAPDTPRTRQMIGRRELDLLKSGAVLVNVSRGTVIDTDALVDRLKRGDIIAGIDAFDPEPIGSHEITRLENVFLSPHFAGVTAACGPRCFALMVDELDRFFHGHETQFDLAPRTLANRRGSECPSP